MSQDKKTQDERRRARMTYRQRWRRDADGAHQYVGACPFNNGICRMMNVFVTRKQEEG